MDFDMETAFEDACVTEERRLARELAWSQEPQVRASLLAFASAKGHPRFRDRAAFHLLLCQVQQRAAGRDMAAHPPGTLLWIMAADEQREAGAFVEWLQKAAGAGAFDRA